MSWSLLDRHSSTFEEAQGSPPPEYPPTAPLPQFRRNSAFCVGAFRRGAAGSGPDIARLAAAVRRLPPAPAALLRRLAPPAAEEGRLSQCSAEDLVTLAEAFAGEGAVPPALLLPGGGGAWFGGRTPFKLKFTYMFCLKS